MMKTGSCLCGAIRYEVRGKLRDVVGCHCTQCRKQSGHYFAATAARRDEMTIYGEENITWFAASEEAKRGFCKTCGSALFWDSPDRAEVSILAGSLDGETGLHMIKHIYLEDKGDYYQVDQGVERCAQADNFAERFS